jgi:catechol 2,3-dioxygenase-like lactoylglutathione lyase family enzyme
MLSGMMPPSPPAPTFAQSVTFLYTEDMAASLRFYGEVLGLPLVLEQAGGGCAIFAAAPGGRAFLGVCRARGPRQIENPRSPGGVVFTLVSDDVDGWHARLAAAEAEVLGPPALSAEHRVYGFFFRDPDGTLLEVQRFEDPGWPTPSG